MCIPRNVLVLSSLSAMMTVAAAAPISVTVRVVDENLQPVVGAQVHVLVGPLGQEFAFPETNASGESAETIDIVDAPIRVLRACVFDIPPFDQENPHTFADSWNDRRSRRFYQLPGPQAVLLPLETSVTIEVAPAAARMVSGSVVGPSAAMIHSVRVLSDPNAAIWRNVVAGSFTIETPANTGYWIHLGGDSSAFYTWVSGFPVDGELAPISPPDISQVGGLVGTIATNGELPSNVSLAALVDVSRLHVAGVLLDTDGRLFGATGSLDPALPNTQVSIPAGTYRLLALEGRDIPDLEVMALLELVRDGTHQVLIAQLPEIVIQPGQRTVMTVDAESLIAATRAVVQEAFFSP